jgi:hypothetical protein
MRRWALLVGALGALVLGTSANAAEGCRVDLVAAGTIAGDPTYDIQASGYEADAEIAVNVLVNDELNPGYSTTRATDSEGNWSELWSFTSSDPYGTYTFRVIGGSCTAEANTDWMPDTATDSRTTTVDSGFAGIGVTVLAAVFVAAFLSMLVSRRLRGFDIR